MKRQDIDKIYTNLVASKLAQGYMISTVHGLEGHQGEIAKIGLIKGNELYVIWMNRERVDTKKYYWEDRIVVRFSKWNYPADYRRTVWLSDLTTISEYSYYQIDREAQIVTSDYHEFVAIQEKRYNRIVNKTTAGKYASHDITSEATREIAVKYLKRVHGYQRISRDLISVFRRLDPKTNTSKYSITYRGNEFKLN